MLTGNKPYQGDSAIETIVAHMADPLPVLPPELHRYQTLIKKMIAKSRDDRFTSAAEMVPFVQQLRKPVKKARRMTWIPSGAAVIAAEMVRLVQQLRKPVKNTRRMTWVSTGAVAIILAIGGSVFIWQSIISDRNEHPATAGMTISVRAVTESSPDIIETPAQEPGNLVRETVTTPVHHEHQTPPGMTTSEGAVPESSPHIVEMPSAEASDLVKETAVPSDNNERNIEKLLSQAATAVKEYRLTKPKNNNAYDYYQQVLELQPQHKKALEGFASIADAYADLAGRKFAQYGYKAAKKYMQRGLTIQPDNTRLLGLQKKADIERNLAQAATALKEYRLTKPENNNAYDYYQQVLELRPQHEKALHGITSIADAYADLAESKLEKFEYKAAKEYVHLGLTIQPENTRLQALQKNTNAFRDAPKRVWKKFLSPFSKAF
jgi:serine/threonine-protein kinase PpkA